MPSQSLSCTFHDRLHLPDYERRLEDVAIDDLAASGSSDSPSQVWAREWLRAELDLSGVDKVPTDLLVWGRGEPRHPAGTKIGGKPVWPSGKPLPVEDRSDWETRAPLRFFGQFNFADSVDILPDLPGNILSIWGTERFLYDEDSMQTFWLNADEVSVVDEYEHPFLWKEFPSVPFYAVLHRSWDRSRRQELLDEGELGSRIEDYLCEASWSASKFGGRPVWIQSEDATPNAQFFLHLKSIAPANAFPHPWINVAEPFEMDHPKNEYHHDRNQLNLSDGGSLNFHLTSWGTVETVFQFC